MSWTRIASQTFTTPTDQSKLDLFIDEVNEITARKGWEGEFDGGSDWGFTDQDASQIFFQDELLKDPDIQGLIRMWKLQRVK
jgi:hypothetical protein